MCSLKCKIGRGHDRSLLLRVCFYAFAMFYQERVFAAGPIVQLVLCLRLLARQSVHGCCR